MTVTLWQLLVGAYVLLVGGTAIGWKGRRTAVMIWGVALAMSGGILYSGLASMNADTRRLNITLAEMNPTWRALYQSLAEHEHKDIRNALLNSFKAKYPGDELSLSATEYGLFVNVSVQAALALSDRVSFDPVPSEIEQTESAVETMLAAAREGLEQKVTFQTKSGKTLVGSIVHPIELVQVDFPHLDTPLIVRAVGKNGTVQYEGDDGYAVLVEFTSPENMENPTRMQVDILKHLVEARPELFDADAIKAHAASYLARVEAEQAKTLAKAE